MFKDIVEKRIHRNETLPHPEMDVLWAGMWRWLLQLHIPFYIFLAFNQDYFPFLATMDAAIGMCFVVYHLTIRQLIKRGVVQAFYRKHYSNASGMFWSFLLIGSFTRSIIFVLYYGICLSWVSGDATKERWNHYMADLQTNLASSAGAIVGVGLCLYLFYSLFYRERFISVVDYSQRVAQVMRRQGLAFNQAARVVLSQKEKEPAPECRDESTETGDGDLFAKFFGYSVAQSQTEQRNVNDMDQKSITCNCSNERELRYVTKIGRKNGKLATVKGVPIYYCPYCEDAFMARTDRLRLIELVKQAVETGRKEIEFHVKVY
ncbi:potassium-transporting ATPase subunit F [Paenibacillus sp. EPM92]|uniref:potassium-transporting ATPase subunit F n=1 Tax=Paenibacillus sp. EPM92 TaxID=1561195 RepID=UPI001915C569|nr:potassium-transporting ATPase subunit F [Paenibacillus sp. EPM92]